MISSQRERGSVVTSIIHPPSSFFVHCIKVITMTPKWAGWHLQSPASWLFTQAFIQAQIKENIKGPRHWPLWGELPVTDEFPAQKASNAENVSIWRHHVRVRLLHITNFSADVKHLLGVTLEIRYSCTRMLVLYFQFASNWHAIVLYLTIDHSVVETLKCLISAERITEYYALKHLRKRTKFIYLLVCYV